MGAEITFGSLFTGIGGIDLGLERAGMECKWQVEIDDHATRILEKHWPNVTRFRDVRECGAHNLGPVDLIAGGFPCQDVSLAGARAGITGARSGLWKEYARIIRELRPRFVLVENVPGLLSGGMGEVLGDLAALGFDAEWEGLPAAAFGAPHRRDRVFIVAYTKGERRREEGELRYDEPKERIACGGEDVADASIDGREPRRTSHAEEVKERRQSHRGGCSSYLSDPTSQGSSDRATPRIFTGKAQGRSWMDAEFERRYRSWWAIEPDVGRVAHGVPKRVDRLRCLGNGVVPQVAEWIGKRILEFVNESY